MKAGSRYIYICQSELCLVSKKDKILMLVEGPQVRYGRKPFETKTSSQPHTRLQCWKGGNIQERMTLEDDRNKMAKHATDQICWRPVLPQIVDLIFKA